MAASLLLDTETNDWVLASNGDIAVASEPYSLAQDAASAIRLVQGECWYDTTQGVRWRDILGNAPPLALIKSYIQQAALSVPGVVSATVYITGSTGRAYTGQVQIIDASGSALTTSF